MTVREYKQQFKGEISVFLSLMSIIIISFIIAILDSAVIKTYGNKSKIDAEAAVFSLFGEFQDELFDDYLIFAVDASYGKGVYTEKCIEDKLRYFGTGNMEHYIDGIQLITDENCAAFRSQAIKYISGPLYDNNIAGFENNTSKWEELLKKGEEALNKDKEYDELIDDLKGSYTPESEDEDNIFEVLEDSKKSSLLDDIFPDNSQISDRKINKNQLLSRRELRKGRGVVYDTSKLYSSASDIAFNEYVLTKYKNILDADLEDPGLVYEVEYILNGEDSDKMNLEKTAEKILALRILPNYTYIKSSSAKLAEIEALSLAITVVIENPELMDLVKEVICWAWAYTESKCDVAALLAGLKVPDIKTEDTWHSGLYDCFTGNVTYNLNECQQGLDYKDHLRILLFADKQEKKTLYCADMAEFNICNKRPEFKMDNCFVRLKVINNAELLKGFTYTFPVEFGYD